MVACCLNKHPTIKIKNSNKITTTNCTVKHQKRDCAYDRSPLISDIFVMTFRVVVAVVIAPVGCRLRRSVQPCGTLKNVNTTVCIQFVWACDWVGSIYFVFLACHVIVNVGNSGVYQCPKLMCLLMSESHVGNSGVC